MFSKIKTQENGRKLSFCKSLPPGENWKSKSMRLIPEELVRSGAFEHRVVFSVRWGNSWQLWLEQEKTGQFMIEEDWDEFVDDNFLGPNDTLSIRHDDTIYFEVQIYDKDGNEIMDVPLEFEPETEPVHAKPQNSHQETTAACASASASASASPSANGGTSGQAKQDCAHVKNPERYLLNPENPYFVKKLAKKNDVLYVSRPAIHRYGLKFGPVNSAMKYLLPEGKEEEAFNKIYSNTPCFSGWAGLCRRHNLKQGDTVVCELERSGGLVTAVRVHFVSE